MIDITLEADYKEVDRTLGSLIRAMSPKPIHSLAARTAWKQVKSKYAQRFASQVDRGSLWQETKRLVGTQLPLGSDPGFLTGTTFKSIAVETTANEGRVYPRGRWPQGSGIAWLDPMTESEYGRSQTGNDDAPEARGAGMGFKWCDGSDWGLEAHLGGGDPQYYKSSPLMTQMKYGEKTSAGEIEWLYLDSQDVDIIVSNLEKYFNHILEKNYQGVKAVFDSTTFRGEAAKGDEFIAPEQEVVDETADKIYSRKIEGASLDKMVEDSLRGMSKEYADRYRAEIEAWFKKGGK